jgi:hypothetical protein
MNHPPAEVAAHYDELIIIHDEPVVNTRETEEQVEDAKSP